MEEGLRVRCQASRCTREGAVTPSCDCPCTAGPYEGDPGVPCAIEAGGDVVALTGQWKTKGEMELRPTPSAPPFQNRAWWILWVRGLR